MIDFIARWLPQKIRMAVVNQFMVAMMSFSPNGKDSTLREIEEAVRGSR